MTLEQMSDPRRMVAAPPVTVPEPTRLAGSPVFVLSTPRAGSTLLRLLLGSHSRVHAPHELHLTDLTVDLPVGSPELALKLAGYPREELEHLLWDRVLHAELARSGRQVLVVKDPLLVLKWQRIAACWPHARYVFLLRHPAAAAVSWQEAASVPDIGTAAAFIAPFAAALEQARAVLPGVEVRYEQLVADPARELAGVCRELGLRFEPGMLDYGAHQPGPHVRGTGDWLDKIHTGRVQPGRPQPDMVPQALAGYARAWGYT